MLEQTSSPAPFCDPYFPFASQEPKRRGRKLTTGRFDTREELVEAVWHDYENTPRKMAEIGRACGVSLAVVAAILDGDRPDTLGAQQPGARAAAQVPAAAAGPGSHEEVFEAALCRLHSNPADKEAWAALEAARAVVGVPMRKGPRELPTPGRENRFWRALNSCVLPARTG